MKTVMRKFTWDESGTTAIEYGLIATVLGSGLVGAFMNFGDALLGLISSVADAFQ